MTEIIVTEWVDFEPSHVWQLFMFKDQYGNTYKVTSYDKTTGNYTATVEKAK